VNKKAVLSVVVLFVVAMLLGFVVHGVLLAGDYGQLPNLMRTKEEAGAHFPYMIAAHVLMAVGLTWVYRRGREDRPWLGQGVRFGLAVAVMATIPMYLVYHAVCPFPMSLVAKQIAFDTVAAVLLGITAAAVNRD
jgi:uncharacterized membrane protein YraQ (UPF0718 family)